MGFSENEGAYTSLLPLPKPLMTFPSSRRGKGGAGPASGPATRSRGPSGLMAHRFTAVVGSAQVCRSTRVEKEQDRERAKTCCCQCMTVTRVASLSKVLDNDCGRACLDELRFDNIMRALSIRHPTGHQHQSCQISTWSVDEAQCYCESALRRDHKERS